LIVDDDAAILELLAEFLSGLGHEFRVANDGLKAISLLEQSPATIVITDIMMPNMDGIELIKNIRKTWPDTDIMAMTGYIRDFTYTDVITAGACDFVQKPFRLDEMEAKLNRIIRERGFRNKLKRLSARDCLTDLFNRRMFDELLEKETERASRQQYPLFLIMIDLDNFKRLNDCFGHREGDRVLKILARVLTASTRRNVDTVFRYGGDEFTVIVPQADSGQVRRIAERIRYNYLKENTGQTCLSLGIAQFRNTGDLRHDINRLIQEADEAMYAAKESGGNAVVLHRDGARGILWGSRALNG